MSTTTNNQGGNSVAAFMNSSDFLNMFPELAQKFVAMNQAELVNLENKLLKQILAAQVAFVIGSVVAGFSSAMQTTMYGAGMAAAGGVQALGNVTEISSSMGNIKDINALQQKTDEELAELNTQNNATNHATIGDDDEPPVEDDDILLQNHGTATRVQKLDNGLDEEKPAPAKTKEEILEGNRTEREKLEQERYSRSQKAQILNSMAQTGQLLAQNAQGNAQVYQMTQQLYTNNSQTATQASQTANETARQISQFDPYAQNRSSVGV